jgi:hypothetical protein
MFKEKDTTQLAAYIIGRFGGKCQVAVFQTVLYLIDREILLRTLIPFSLDKWVHTINGPCLATINQWIADPPPRSYWSEHIGAKDESMVVLKDPGDGYLSDFDCEVADEVCSQYLGLSPDGAIALSKTRTQEWAEDGNTDLAYEEVLGHFGMNTPEYIGAMRNYIALSEFMQKIAAPL